MKVCNVTIKRWFDKVNGNSYFAARAVLVQDGADDIEVIAPFQYGYGSQPEWVLCGLLTEKLNTTPTDERRRVALSTYCRENNIRLFFHDTDVKKRDCKF